MAPAGWELSDGRHRRKHGRRGARPEQQTSVSDVGDVAPITLAGAATLIASATDDGLPKPYRNSPSNPDRDSQPRRPRGVQIKWIQYRGPGKVTFDPQISAVVYGEPVTLTSKVTFGAPGTYVFRATANDGQLYHVPRLTVTVNPSVAGQRTRAKAQFPYA